eukprot:13016177-Ditylum_brightwellii.AAC.1
MKSHIEATLTLGKGCVISKFTKQKVNSQSSTEAELVAVDDKISKDNESAIKLEKNGKESS